MTVRPTVWSRLNALLQTLCVCCGRGTAEYRHIPTGDELCYDCAKHSDDVLLPKEDIIAEFPTDFVEAEQDAAIGSTEDLVEV